MGFTQELFDTLTDVDLIILKRRITEELQRRHELRIKLKEEAIAEKCG